MTRTTICQTCRYFEPLEGGGGHCRRYAPRPAMLGEIAGVEDTHFRQWPEVEDDDWCGEWALVRPGDLKQ